MTLEFIGKHYPIDRVVTGFHSLDQALKGNEETIGWPTRTLGEIYGPTGVGKTTLSLSLLGILSRNLGDLRIAFLDLENQDENMVKNAMISSGYRADKFVWIDPDKDSKGNLLDSDEYMLDKLTQHLYTEPPHLGLLDSVASIASVAEVGGQIGDANMGRRAFPMAQFTRRMIRALRSIESPTSVIMANHWYKNMQQIGGMTTYTSPGGEVKQNLEHLRIQVKVPFVDYVSSGDSKVEGRWEPGWILEGKVEKNRAGTKNEKFQVFIYGGWGAHAGMSALIDCLAAGHAKVASGKVVMDGVDYGLLKRIVDKGRDDEDMFVPFHNTLMSQSGVTQGQNKPEPKKRGRKKK